MTELSTRLGGAERTTWWSRWAGLALFAAANLALCVLGRCLTPAPDHVAVFWPSAGLVSAVLIVAPRARWPGLVGAAVLSSLLFNAFGGHAPLVLAAFTLVNAALPLAAAEGTLRACRGRPRLSSARDVLAFVLFSAVVAMAGNVVAALALWQAVGAPLLVVTFELWVGSALGVLTTGALVLAWAQPCQAAPERRPGLLEHLGLAGAFLLAAWLGLVRVDGASTTEAWLLPVLAWAALRFGPRQVTALVFATTLGALSATLLGRGAFARLPGGPGDHALAAQISCALASVTALFMASIVEARRRSARALRASEEKYRLLVENQTDLVVKLDAQGRFLFASPSYCRTFGRSEAELLGQPFMLVVHEDDRVATGELRERLFRAPWEAQLEHRVLTADGWRCVSWAATAVRDGSGRVTALVGVGRDVTERRVLDERLRQAEKLEGLGRLAGGVAHDFNNQLTGILSGAEYLAEAVAERPELLEVAQEIRDAAQRSARLSRQLLAFARSRPVCHAPVDVHRIVHEVLAMLGRTVDKRIALRAELAAPRSAVMGDPDRVHGALLNLAINACDAMPDGGTLTLETSLAAAPVKGAAGEALRIVVRDTGVGMSPEVRARIFEPFFTTKPVGKGSGLGLAEVYGTITAHQGAITVESAPGRGTAVTLLLPLAPEAPVAAVRPEPVERSDAAPLSILIADDEDGVRRSLARLLRHRGHEVVECDGGREALVRHAEREGAIDLAIVDVMMPDMTGRELVTRLRARAPGLPVIVSSGYAAGAELEALRDQPDLWLLGKPYRAEELDRLVGQAARRVSPRPRT